MAEIALFFFAFWGPPRLRGRDALASMSLQVDWAVLVNFAVWLWVALWIFNEFNRHVLVERKAPAASRTALIGVLFGCALAASAVGSASPLLTLYKSSQIILSVIFGYLWVLKFGPRKTLGLLMQCSLLVCAGLLILGVLAPSLVWTGSRLMGGAFGGAGSVSALLAVGALVGLGFESKRVRLLAILVASLLLLLSQVRSGYVSVLVCVLLAVFMDRRENWARRALVSTIAAAPFVAVVEAWTRVASYLMRDPNSVSTLSDRVPLWRYVIGIVWNQAPVLGVGFYAERTITLLFNAGIGTAHSAYVEVFAGAGVVGAVLFLALVGSGFLDVSSGLRSAGGSSGHRVAGLAGLLMVACLMPAFTSDELVTGGPTGLAFFVLLAVASWTAVHPSAVDEAGAGEFLA